MDMPEEIRNRYKATVQRIDKLGRSIIVGRLRMSQETKAAEYAESFASVEMMRTICSVREIDGDQISFPQSRAMLDALMDRLDREGVEAIRDAMAELNGTTKKPEEEAEAAKN